jgi:deoxyribodipyrimidine photo-lyase
MPAVLWFRRDLRRKDNPALLDACSRGSDGVLPLFVLDPALWDASGPVRRTYLVRSLRSLDESLGGRLVVVHGDPAVRVPDVVRTLGAGSVHVAADFGPYGRRRDAAVESALAGVELVRTGSPYAVSPGRVRTQGGAPFKVYTPFYRAWVAHGWRVPAADPPPDAAWLDPGSLGDGIPQEPQLSGVLLPDVGEQAALRRWESFRVTALPEYATARDRADLAGTSALSAALRWGEVHPRTLLAELGDDRGAETYRKELAWREFYADVLWHEPRAVAEYLRPEIAELPQAGGPSAEAAFTAWAEGRTGFPFVDAGMRQLRAEGWMHNRVRMLVASFLVKDLHQDWRRGAREFMHWLRDGDLASNQLNWQWVAGSGTDAAPYFRVFNPVLQGLKFDPEGTYVRRYVPELRGVAGAAVHEPWDLPSGLPTGYPERLVDHAQERQAALDAFTALRRPR